jgi:hypothetical protein
LLQSELADCLQHAEPRLAVGLLGLRHQGLVDERSEPFQDVDSGALWAIARRRDHRLGRLQGEAADEDGEAAKQGLLIGGEEVVAPGDRVPHRAQPSRLIARTASQEW